jgi:hypothetical protein
VISTRVVELDGTGAGRVNVPPAWYAGSNASHGETILADGDNLGTTLPTYANMRVVAGDVTVTGGVPDGEVALYFSF